MTLPLAFFQLIQFNITEERYKCDLIRACCLREEILKFSFSRRIVSIVNIVLNLVAIITRSIFFRFAI